ncbi:MAG: Lsr2 family protein [Actinomycetota bacterium]|nr:Lsr2 family protein [Actinomycetota bacterium]MDQ6946116.1 Lsr2 family protein [Actinomycetota bacterium]
MAKLQVVSYNYTCDVCGGTIPDSDGVGATRIVSWDGTDYVVDVCASHASQLGELLTQLKGFVDAGHREAGRRGRRAVAATNGSSPRATRGRRAASTSSSGTAPKRGDVGIIRAWARDNGYQVSERGRIPATLFEAYDAATSAPAPEETPKEAPARKRAARKASPGRKRTGRKAAPAEAE